MTTYTATEQAYKNGYEAGVREFAERLKKKVYTDDSLYENEIVDAVDIDTIAEELIDKQRKEDENAVGQRSVEKC